ncbi:MAG: acyl-CoA carboxylase subunit beta, partial [Terriglobia bacterium]
MPRDPFLTQVDPSSEIFAKNARRMADLMLEIKNQEETLREGGGERAIESQHKKNRLTARERIARLIDPEYEFFELGIYAAHRMYEE